MNPKDMTDKELVKNHAEARAFAENSDYDIAANGALKVSEDCAAELLRRLDALRKENYNASQACLDYQSEHEELEKDKERLNWLAHETFLPKDHPTTGVFAVVCEDVAPLGTFGDFGEADELAFRAVIDTAIAKESEASHE